MGREKKNHISCTWTWLSSERAHEGHQLGGPTLFYTRALVYFSQQLKGVFIILDLKMRKQR